jgi:hypothetical protein
MNAHQLLYCYLNIIIFISILCRAYPHSSIKPLPCLSPVPFTTKLTQSSNATSEMQRELSAVNQEQEHAKESHTCQPSGIGQDRKSNGSIQAFSTWVTLTSYHDATMSMVTRSSRGNNCLLKIEEMCLKNKAINDEIRKNKAVEEKKKKAEATKAANPLITEDVSNKAVTITPRNLHNMMNGGIFDPLDKDNDTDKDVEVLMEIEGAANEAGEDMSGMSPLNKRSRGKKRSSSRPRVTPPESKSADTNTSNATKSASFLDEVVYPHSHVILELVITLKSDKAFEESTQALMAFITNAQMVDPKFVINPINPPSKDKNISNKGKTSSNMMKLGTHIKISGNGNAFNKKKIWNNKPSNRKSRKSQREQFCNPTVYFSMVISTKVEPLELINRLTHEWSRLNGSQLQVKDLQSISSEMVVTFFKMSTATPKKVLLVELARILVEAQKRCRYDLLAKDKFFDTSTYNFTLNEGVESGESLPPMNLRVQNALLRGQEVTVFNRLSHHAQQAQKSWHLEVDSRHAGKMKALVECAKAYGWVEEM